MSKALESKLLDFGSVLNLQTMTELMYVVLGCKSYCFKAVVKTGLRLVSALLACKNYPGGFFCYVTQSLIVVCYPLLIMNHNHTRKWNVLCWNIRGLNDVRKWDAVRNKVVQANCDVVCFQETKRASFDGGFSEKCASSLL